MRSLTQTIYQLKEQATPRALIGIFLLVGILAILAYSEIARVNSQLRSQTINLQRDLTLSIALSEDESLIERSKDIRLQLDEIHSAFWVGSTQGIIQAQLQGRIEEAARNAKLSNIRVNILNEPLPLAEDAVLFEISVTARDRNGQFLIFFQELVRINNMIVITQFEWNKTNGILKLGMEAPAMVQDPSTSENMTLLQ